MLGSGEDVKESTPPPFANAGSSTARYCGNCKKFLV